MINITNEFLVRLKKLGYTELTPIQKIAIPKILSGKNVLIIAPTGFGKTEASIIPIYYKIFKERPEKISALYITPLRALNRDLQARLERLGEAFEITVKIRHGDSSTSERKQIIENPPDLLITTPETLLYLILNDKFREYFSNLKWIIIDELQEMLDEKRGIELSVLLQRIKRLSKNRIQLIGISATIGDIEVAKKYLGYEVEVAKVDAMKNMEINIAIPKERDQEYTLKLGLKPETVSRILELKKIIEGNKPVLVFTNTRETSEFLSNQLSKLGLRIGTHHGSLSKDVRIETENEFKKGNIDAIIATSSLELGIDIGRINLVIQYMSPRQVIRLVQRIGRAGHSIEKTSKGIIIPSDDIFDILECKAIIDLFHEGYLEKPLIEKNPLDVASHEIAGMVLEGYNEPEEILNVLRNSFYFETLTEEKFNEILDLMESAKIIRRKENKVIPGPRIWKYYYNVNMIPDSLRSYMVIDYSTNTKLGVLDEEFVATLDNESVFILSGRLWKVVSIEDDKIFVERAELKSGILPSWFGESIPVEKEVAKKVFEYIQTEEDDENVVNVISKHKSRGYPLPRSDEIVVEIIGNDLLVLHSPFGSRGNNTLGTIFSVLLSNEKSVKTSFRADPYHIAVASILPINRYDVQRVIEKINSFDINHLLEILRQGIKESPQFKWKLLVEIERFGMVDFDKKDIQITSPILKAYTNTLVGEEAVNELLVQNHDVEVINEIKKFSWKIVEVIEPSPIAREFLDKLMSYTTSDDTPLVIEVYKRKLMSKEVKVICLVCGWSSKYTVINAPNKCPKCNSIFLTATSPDDKDAERIIRDAMLGKRLKGNEKRKLEDLKTIASLFSSYGKHAFIALSANGIGPSNLGRVLSKLSEGEDRFYLAIMEEEKRFLKTKQYWH